MVDYGHSKGALMGWYENNCICMDEYKLQANTTYAQLAYAADAQILRDSGFDSIKLDNCGDDQGVGFVSRAHYINISGRPLLIENSDQGHGLDEPRGLPSDPDGWCGANFFRAEGDIGPDYNGIMNRAMDLLQYQHPVHPISRPGCWAYLDMLEVGNQPLTYNESRSHFGLWCINSSPLVLGFDLTNTSLLTSVWDIITNEEAIAVNQHWAGHPGRFVWKGKEGAYYSIYAKKLANGAMAVIVENTDSTNELNSHIPMKLLGLDNAVAYSARDLWNHKDLPTVVGNWTLKVWPHDSAFVIFTPAIPPAAAPGLH
jgi:hypothetical protein